jgi:predicted tellurium resistance membrane protein TerC
MELTEQFAGLFTFASLVSLITLSVLEIVLGIDNIIFISIISDRLPHDQQSKGRIIGLSLALLMRIALLFSITWVIGMQTSLFHLIDTSPYLLFSDTGLYVEQVLWSCSGRDLILLAGGIFLLVKTTSEIHKKVEGEDEFKVGSATGLTLNIAIIQIVLIDMVFSFDSILTAVGLVDNILIMILAVVIAMGVMLVFAERVSLFVNNNPTIKILALAFLLMIGMILIIDAFHYHVPKGYIYFSMAFSLLVESLNLRMKKNRLRKRRKVR